MWWFIVSFVASVALLIVLDRTYRYFVDLLTIPIEKDVAGESIRQYARLYETIHHREPTRTEPHSIPSRDGMRTELESFLNARTSAPSQSKSK